MLTKEQNEMLCRVGPGTPGGEYLRRFWQAVYLSSELRDFPRRIRILGEDLVLFRDRGGKPGLVGLQCPHRLASLEFGTCEKNGIRCRYHGWLFGADGRCLEQPAEPEESTYKDRVDALAYPVKELGGLVFAYMGPGELPELPNYDVLVREDGIRVAARAPDVPCNWVQTFENVMDPWHTYFLHLSVPEWSRLRPDKIVWEKATFGQCVGMSYTALRPFPRPGFLHVRQTFISMPNVGKVAFREGASPDEIDYSKPAVENLAFHVPVDDNYQLQLVVMFRPEGAAELDEIPQIVDGRSYWPPRQDSEGRYIMDNVNAEDTYIQVSQGLITPREGEHLATSDRGVTMCRQLIWDGIEAVRKGLDPPGVLRDKSMNKTIRLPARDELVPAEREAQPEKPVSATR